MRNAFIRISAKNNTKNGLVEYGLEDVKKLAAAFADRYQGAKYALIRHDRDQSPDGKVAEHFHIFFKFGYPVKFQYIKEAFQYGNIQQVRSANACVQYLIHKNNPEKAQYRKEEIISNFPQDEFDAFFVNDKKVVKLNEADELEQILQDIADCKIRRFNMSEFVSVQMYSKYRTRIENAFRYKKLSDWYSKVPDEAKRQLYRRISLYVEVEKNEIFLYEMDEHLKKTLKVTMKNAVPSLLAQKPADRQDEFLESTVKSYYTALADDLPDEEVQAGLSSVKRNGTKEIPQEQLPF